MFCLQRTISYGSNEKVLSGSETCKEAKFLRPIELQLELLIRFYWIIILIIFEAKFLCRHTQNEIIYLPACTGICSNTAAVSFVGHNWKYNCEMWNDVENWSPISCFWIINTCCVNMQTIWYQYHVAEVQKLAACFQ